MKIKSQRDFWSGLMFVAVGVFFGIGSRNYSLGVSARPGPGYFPLLLSVIMVILGLVILFKALTIETEGGDPIGAVAWKPLITIVAAITVFGFLLPHLGMAIALPALTIGSALAGSDFNWKDAVLSAVVLTAFCWLVFIWGLGLTIPLWPTFLDL